MEQGRQPLLDDEWELRCQLLATLAGLASGAMALVVLWASWQQLHGALRPADAPCLTVLPRIAMGLSLPAGAYGLYTAWQQRGETPVQNNRLLLAAAALSALSTVLEANVLFCRTQGLTPRELLDTVLDVLD